MLRKVAVAAASKPHVEIRQDGDQFYIKTSTTVRTTEINFKVGEGFEEETVDGRKCRVRHQSLGSVPGSPLPTREPLRPDELLLQPVARFPCKAYARAVCREDLCNRFALGSGERPTPSPPQPHQSPPEALTARL